MTTDKKKLILETASQLFLSYGIQHLTMDDIANDCGISKKTIYKHFQNKSDLILQIIEIKITTFSENLSELNSVSENAVNELYCFFNIINDLVRSFSPTVLKDLRKFHLTFYLKYEQLKTDIILPFLIANIKKGIQENLYKSDLNIEETTHSILNILNVWFKEDFIADKASFKSLEFLQNILLHRLITLKGLKKLSKVTQN
ncbi:transcriptional regulator, TetR family [Lutibacter oricola]|uniref:Transcriptional regulator, TetR family n=1 Tax=Lutibacter oricola TaxID=762486 RepID=A0A1H3A313_9FLAO|nr:TetR/AcrR family transcriptional regulator [Lutibacter oricola]SDX24015.1 transcriptional regulator, TetR family [Lutibacter oricola]